MFKKMAFLSIAMVVAVGLSNSCFAQGLQPEIVGDPPPIPDRMLHEFNDQDDEVIALGQFVELEGATVTIRNANHELIKLKMNDLNQEDRRWVNRQAAKQKKDERLAQEAGKAWLAADRAKPRTVVKACNKLKNYGRAAGQQAARVRAMFPIEDDRAKLACLATYAHICKLDFQSLKIIVGEVTKDQHGAHDVVMERPGPFLDGIASMDYLGLLYLRYVANSCNLKAEPGWIDNETEPVTLDFISGPKSNLRRAAIEAIGEIKGEDAAAALLDLAPTVETPINGKRDDETISALIKSLGKIGVNNGEVVALLRRYEKDLPKVTAKALDQIGEN